MPLGDLDSAAVRQAKPRGDPQLRKPEGTASTDVHHLDAHRRDRVHHLIATTGPDCGDETLGCGEWVGDEPLAGDSPQQVTNRVVMGVAGVEVGDDGTRIECVGHSGHSSRRASR